MAIFSYTSNSIDVPFHVRLVCNAHEGDRLYHRLEFGVVGTDFPAKVIVSSDMYSSPVIEDRESRGGIELPDRLMDLLALACFKVVAGFIMDYDGECATWTSKDITHWIRTQFTAEDADQICRALSLQVTPGVAAENEVVVGDDDIVMASNYR